MFKETVTERIPVDEGTLIICRKYMALETPDEVLQPADMDEYGMYLPIWELIRLLSYNADLSPEITEQTREAMKKVFLGQHPRLSHILYCSEETADRNQVFLDTISPKTEADYVRLFALVQADLGEKAMGYPFVCREELRDYLGGYMDEELAFGLSEAVRKGKFYDEGEDRRERVAYGKWRAELDLLPETVVKSFSEILYLPEKALVQRIVRYTILAANSLIKNNNGIQVGTYCP